MQCVEGIVWTCHHIPRIATETKCHTPAGFNNSIPAFIFHYVMLAGMAYQFWTPELRQVVLPVELDLPTLPRLIGTIGQFQFTGESGAPIADSSVFSRAVRRTQIIIFDDLILV